MPEWESRGHFHLLFLPSKFLLQQIPFKPAGLEGLTQTLRECSDVCIVKSSWILQKEKKTQEFWYCKISGCSFSQSCFIRNTELKKKCWKFWNCASSRDPSIVTTSWSLGNKSLNTHFQVLSFKILLYQVQEDEKGPKLPLSEPKFFWSLLWKYRYSCVCLLIFLLTSLTGTKVLLKWFFLIFKLKDLNSCDVSSRLRQDHYYLESPIH